MSDRSTAPRPSVVALLLTFAMIAGVVAVPALAAQQGPGVDVRWHYFGNVPAEAKAAMEDHIGALWSEIIDSNVPIDIEVTWQSQGSSILASAGASDFGTTPNGPVSGVAYPIALVEALDGQDSDADANPEIEVTINSDMPWDYASGSTQPGKVDFIGTVVHEVGHGLGFGGFLTRRSDGTGHYFGTPTIFDMFVADQTGTPIIDKFSENSTALGNALISDALFWNGADGVAAAGGNDCGPSRSQACPTSPKIYAPSPWESGSSLVHWDEATYPAGHANALMTPTAIGNETAQTIGPMTVGMMHDIGWPEPGTATEPPTDPPTDPTTDPTDPTDPPTAPPGTGDVGGGAWDGDPATTERVGTNSPVATAIRMSRARFVDDFGAAWVVLSRDDVFADSLSGTPLTSLGPLLLTPSNTLDQTVREEIDRVLIPGDPVYLLGGEAALSAAIEAELANAGYEIRRLSGANRFETSLVIADEVRFQFIDGGQAIVARAFGTETNPTAGWADSVTAGGYAAYTATPILLSPTEGVTPDVNIWLDFDNPTVTWVIGGQAALSDQVQRDVPKGVRVFGVDRAATALAIAEQMWGATRGTGRWMIVDGFGTNGWAFGLAAAGLSADGEAPLMPVRRDGVPFQTGQALSSCGAPAVDLLVIGGSGIIGDAVVADLDNRDGHTC